MNKSSHLPFFGLVKNSRRILEAILMAFVLLICVITQINAQISGTIFMDGNNNGTYETATEVPFAFVTVKATDAAGAMFTATSATNGTYTITGTNTSTMYRLEFTYPDGYLDGAQAIGSGSSVQFALGNATNVNQGVYVANTCDPDGVMRVMFSSGLDSDGTDFGLRSWDYTADRRAVNMMGSGGSTTPHTDDIPISAAGVAYGIAVQKGTNLGFFTTISSDLTTVFPADPVGEDVIRIANYSGAGNSYVSNKLLVDLGAFGISTSAISPSIDGTFGTHGLGGIAISDDGKTLYAINMGKRNLIKIDISGINYATIPGGGYTGAPLVVTEIALPNASCTNGTFRPGALDFHAGNLYIGGVCDANSGTAANLQVKAYEMNPVSNTFTQVLSYTPDWLTAGLRLGGDWPHAPWSTTYPSGDGDGDPGTIQPHFFSIAFDDYGAMIIGFVNREVFVDAGSTREPGYLLRTWRNADGTFTLENDGVSGPLTSTARTRNVDGGGQPGNFTPDPPGDYNNGPGNDWFFENGRTRSHPNLYTGGALVVPGTGFVVGGFADPGNPIWQTGGRYINFETGRSEYGTSVIGAKATVMAAGDVVCDDPTVEVGNRIWMDTDGNGIQDADEMALAGITVQLYNGSTLIATAVTNSSGNYIFSSDPLGTTSSSHIYNLGLIAGTNYTIRVPNVQGGSKQTSLGTKILTTPNLTGTTNSEIDKIDSDGILVGNNAEVTFLLVSYGANNHTLDFGFTALTCPVAGTNGSTNVCDNSTLTITLSSLISGDSTGGVWSRVSGSGGTFNSTLGTFIPTGATTSIFRYIVSAPGCPNDTSEVTVNVSPFRSAGTDGSDTECDGSGTVIDLYSIITGEQTGGTWSRLTGSGGTFNSGAGTFTVLAGTTTSTFRYIVLGTSPCPNDTSVATVTITAAPTAGTGSSTTVCENSTSSVNLFNLLTGESSGGTWSRLTGTGGIFNAGAGTFVPAIGSTTSTFRYTVGGGGCPTDTEDVTVNIQQAVNAGTDGSDTECDGSGTIIDLFSVITGEQTGGTWSRLTGSGGTFNSGAGTFTVLAGTTTSTFRYIVLGTSPCPNDTSVATVTITSAPTAGTGSSTTVCENSTSSVNLFNLLTGESSGGTWSRLTGTGGTFNAGAGTFVPAIGSTTSTFRYTVGGGGCPTDTEDVTVNIQQAVNAGIDGNTSECDGSLNIVDLNILITGEQTGGTWSRLTGSGGTFNSGAGTFTVLAGTTTSTFRYIVLGTSPCPNDTSVATVTITAAPTAGTGSSTTICENSTVSINLYNLLTGENSGGTWSRLTGIGGTFNAGAGTYIPAIGSTTSTFRYIVGGSGCPLDTADVTVNIQQSVNAGIDGNTSECDGSLNIVDLNILITGEQTGGTWSRLTGSGGTFNSGAGTFTVLAGTTTSTFRYIVIGTSPCPNDTSVATITITPAPSAGTGSSITVCETSTTTINLFNLLTGENSGGTWSRLSGTGGTFNAGAGTYIPAIGATTSTFRYIIGGSGCPFDTADVIVNITLQPLAGVDGTIDACAGGGVIINLFSVITDEGTGGTWSRISGSGGTFDPIAGTFSVTIGATSSTFRYIILGTSPCINDTSIATVNVTGLCCMMDITQTTVNPCNSNGTYTNPGDDYFTVTLNATNIASSAPFLYEVYYNGNLLGTSSYGTPITLGTATLPPLKPDGVSTYKLFVRDRNLSTCVDSVIIGPVTPCPILSHSKILSSITNLNDRDYRVVYNIQVTNVGGPGSYGLTDLVGFDDDISILARSYTTNAPGNSGNPGPQVLSGFGPWTLATGQSIASATSHNYTLTVDVRIDLSSTSLGNNIYTPCTPGTGGTSGTFGQGLFNQSSLDNDNDGDVDEVDDACGDLPYIIHEKTYLSTTQTGPRNYRINYQITVRNLGGVSGTYELVDQPNFDSDIIINSSNYTSNAPGNIANPGPSSLIGTGPWTFASNQSISAGSVHTYNLSSNVTINLEGGGTGDDIYRECGDALTLRPSAGEGAFNQSSLNYDLDPNPEELDTACVDLPYIVHNKTIQSVTDLGSKNFRVVYQIRVDNLGGASGSYNLTDIPGFEDDFQITSANYTSNALGNPANPGPITLATSGSWILASDQLINAGQSQIFTITVEASIDLVDIGTVGDEIYRACGSGTPGIPSSGEGLFNRSTLDVNDDGIPEQIDTVCADVKIWDLALRKILLTNPPYTYGQTVQFEITVFNQGNETANNIEVKDYIPTGYSFSPNNGWSGAAPLITKTITTSILPRDSAKILLNLVISQTRGGNINWVNYSEISASQDLSNANRSLDDIDSRVNSDGVLERAVMPNTINDNNIISQNKGGEEDDHDPDGIQIYDLALKKTKVNTGPYIYGMTVPFTITIYNQGSIASRNIRIVDYIPSGFTFNSGANPGWTGGVGTAEYLYVNTLNPGDSVALTLNLVVTQVTNGDFLNAWTNYAEIKGSENTSGIDMTNEDIDSDADGTNGNDPGGRVESPADNYVNGTGTGAVGEGVAATDEDDHDPERIKIWDLALKKVYTSGSIQYGSPLTFTMTVYNQGNDTARNVVISDYIPVGYTYTAALNPAWSGTYPNVNRTISGPIAPGDSASVTIVLTLENTVGGRRNWVNYAEIFSSQDNAGNNRSNDDIDSNVGSNTIIEQNVLPGSVNDNNITSTNKGGEEDDHDPAGVEVFDLALRKTTPNRAGPFNYGDVVPFTIKVFNQGNIAATNVEIIDHIPAGFGFGSNPGWNLSVNTATRTIVGPIAPGDSAFITINLIVQVPADGNFANAWYNEAEITRAIDEYGNPKIDDIDGYFDADKNDDNDVVAESLDDNEIHEDGRNVPTEDQDDNDPEQVHVWDLALRKLNMTAGPYSYNQNITFNIKVFNQGNDTAQNIRVTDYIPVGYSYVGASNPGWTGTYPNVSYVIPGPLAPGDSSIINLVLVLENSDGGIKDWVNYAEITRSENLTGTDKSTHDADSYTASNTAAENAVLPGGVNDNNISSTNKGGEEDDHDPAGVDIYDLALKKTKALTGPFEYGQNIPFTLTIYNQGNISARNIRVIDYIPNGFSFNSGLNPGWTGSVGIAEYLYSNTVLPGDSVKLTINLTAQPVTSNFFRAWTNYAEIKSSANLEGIDMTFADIDSDADMNNNNDPGGRPDSSADNFVNGDGSGVIGDSAQSTDEDDHDPERIKIWDLALRKVMMSSGTLTYGQNVMFRISVYNQGNDTATNIVVGDYIPEGYNYSAANNPNWTGSYPNISQTLAGSIAPGDSASVTLMLELNQSNGGTKDWVNYSEILNSMDASGANRSTHDADSEVGSNNTEENAVLPGSVNDNNILSHDKYGEEDDHDPAGPQIYDLALIKKPETAGPYNYNQIVEFKIWVYNQGNINADEIQLVDYIPLGFEFDHVLSTPIWTYNSITRKATTNLSSMLAAGDSVSVSIYLKLVPTSGGTTNWINYSEIIASQDDKGNNMTNLDIDSNPNFTQSDDPGGRPLTSDDDDKDGNGKNGEDEDDHDPALIEVIDLALRKTLVTSPPYTYGQNHDYRIVIYNQGNEFLQNVKITDYMPNGYTFLPSSNFGWAAVGSNVEYTITDPIVPGDSIILNLILRLDQTTGDIRNWVNYAEITSMEDTASISRTNDDIDSNPQSDNPTERDVFPGEPEDNNIISIDKGGEEDDHDPAGPSIFDLAQKKWTIQTGPFKYNDLVTFNIRVFNQGNEPASNIEITDYVPCGFEFVTVGNSSWAYNILTRKATRTIGSSLLPGDSTTISIILKVIPCANNEENAWTNISEISSAFDSDRNPGEDIDSNPNSDSSDDTGGIPDSLDDNKIDGDRNAGEDEDDHDPARIEVLDLALRKKLVTAGPYRYGDVLDFNIMIKNQGNVPMENVQVQDYLPSGYYFNSGINPNWTGTNPLISRMIRTRLNPGDSIVLPLKLTLVMTSGSEKAYINYAEITQLIDTNMLNRNADEADSRPGSDGLSERAVEPGFPADDDINSIDRGGEEDDHDPAGIEVFDLAQKKWTIQTGPFRYNDLVTFNIRVYNQGSMAANTIELTDYIPCGYEFVNANNPSWILDPLNSIAKTTIAGPFVPGDSMTVQIVLKVIPCYTDVSKAWTNYSEISIAKDPSGNIGNDIDSNPNSNPSDDTGGEPNTSNDDKTNGDSSKGEDEDDHDPARIEVIDVALKKELVTPTPYTYGQLLDFNIKIYNQGNVPLVNTKVEDHIPIGFSYSPADNPGWTGAYPEVSTVYAPKINPGQSTSVSIKLRLLRTDGGYRDWINYTEVAELRDTTGRVRDNDDADSRPDSDLPREREVVPGSEDDDDIFSNDRGGEEDDHDPAGPEIFDLALRKKFTGNYPLRYNQSLPFEITIFNQGNITAMNPEIIDYIPNGYNYVAASNSTWSYDAASRKATTIYNGNIIPGDSAKVTIYLKLAPVIGQNKSWVNVGEIKSVIDTLNDSRPDIDSDPDPDPDNDGDPKDDKIDDPTDEDDHDPAEPQIVDFALRKWVPNEKLFYLPGDTVHFIISLHNQGNVSSSQVGIKDYLPNGFTFPAAINVGWSVVGSILEYSNNVRLNPNDSIKIPLKLIVRIPASNVSVESWENYAEIRNVRDTFNVNRTNDDADSQPLSDTPMERMVHDGNPWDNEITGNGTTELPKEDEDDHDPERVTVTAYLGDKVWKDLDGDGVQDAGEMPLRGVYVTIYDCATGAVVQRDTTDINGNYGFEGLFGDKDYYVRFDASPLGMPNCAWTFKDRGGNDRTDSDVNASGITDCTRLDWGERDSTVDAGFVELAAYGDYVWHDRDVDGQQEFGEEGIAGVTVTLYDAATNQIVRTGITDNNGQYFFDKLMPMQYYAKYTRPAGYGDTDFNRGSDVTDNDVDASNGAGTNATTYLSPGETDRTWDYGVYKCSCISGEVWYDLNKDGIYQDIENGINGLSVYLVNAMTGDVVASAITGPKPGTPSDDGFYSFCSCLRPGMYYVRYDRPGDLAASAAFQGTDRTKDSHLTHAYGPNTSEKITVLSGSDIKDIHAGFQVKAVVGNFVWLDGNQNGLQDSGEKPVQGVKVAAYNTAGVMVSESTTGVDGKYLLDGIAAGDYYVKFVPNSQYGFTTANRGNDDIDSDVTGTQGLGTTQVMRLNTGDAIPHVDAGLILSVLPLEWLGFTAEYNGSFTELNWSTGTEINNSHFEIERRHESEKDFEKIGQESASTNASATLHEYSHDDYDVVMSGLYYYRIKQVDRDGKYSYSKIVAIKKLKANDLSVYIYPNPVRDLLKVEIDLSTDEDVIVDVVDANGKVIMHQPFGGRMKAGRSNKILNTESLTSGNYVIRIKTNQTVVSKKFTVAK
ncbi:MAG: DUF11 domain-containing protein [Saprospiraceae bacterium]|nr:DUF11 domain-containing protein [Saprospiraceae bacterium]